MDATTTFPRELSDSDALLWRIESDPVLRSPVLVIALLDREPPFERIVAAFERAAGLLPRLSQRIVPGPFGSGRLRWEDDPAFAVDHHVRAVRTAGGNDLDAVLRLVEPDATAAFDPARPPWQALFVEGLSGGRAALVLRFHHAITDGVGGMQLADVIFDRTRRPSGAPEPEPGHHAAAGSPALDRWVRTITSGVAAFVDPIGTFETARRAARSVARLLAPAAGETSPILAGRSIDRTVLVTEAPLATFELAAATVDGTVNDIFLAAVGGAVRRYHEMLGSPVDSVRVTMPINLRSPDDPPGGNRFAPARFVLPIDDPDLPARARIAGAIVRRWRAEPSLKLTDGLATVLNRLPNAVVVRLFAGLLRSIDVDAVDVPGLRRAAYLAGAKVERLWAFAPPTGAALSVALVSHGDTACIGVNCDRAAVAEPELLVQCLDYELDELVAVAGAPHLEAVAT